ncbi:MAG TPA: class I SAM-dependent methyltransferase [Longimicrobiaceae bacterium]
MSRFGPDPRAFFDGVYREVAPWDIGGPQPDMVELLAALPPSSPVLDVGCGSGDLAIHIAKSGVAVLGIDFVEAAIELARAKAAALTPEVAARLEFRVADAFRLRDLQREFGAVVDSGFLHLLTPEEGDRFLEEAARVLRSGGRYYLQEFATEFDVPNTPRAISEQEVRERFTPVRGWRILAVRPGEFQSRIAPVPAIVACAERLPAASD